MWEIVADYLYHRHAMFDLSSDLPSPSLFTASIQTSWVPVALRMPRRQRTTAPTCPHHHRWYHLKMALHAGFGLFKETKAREGGLWAVTGYSICVFCYSRCPHRLRFFSILCGHFCFKQPLAMEGLLSYLFFHLLTNTLSFFLLGTLALFAVLLLLME